MATPAMESGEELTRDDYVFLARVQENAERFDEMAVSMKKVAESGSPLNAEERNLLSVAYKNIIGSRRSAWRVINGIESRERSKNHMRHVSFIEPLRKKMEAELDAISTEILTLLDKTLIPSATTPEGQTFYLKMKGDYYRYVAEFKDGEERQTAAREALGAYTKASEIANASLIPTHPIRLGLALNFSVFHYEILGTVDTACKLARQAFDDAVARLDSISDEAYKDASLILQLLRDNLSLWVGDLQDPKNDEDKEPRQDEDEQ